MILMSVDELPPFHSQLIFWTADVLSAVLPSGTCLITSDRPKSCQYLVDREIKMTRPGSVLPMARAWWPLGRSGPPTSDSIVRPLPPCMCTSGVLYLTCGDLQNCLHSSDCIFFFLGAPSQVVPRSCDFLYDGDTAVLVNTNKPTLPVLKMAYPSLGRDFLIIHMELLWKPFRGVGSHSRVSKVLVG